MARKPRSVSRALAAATCTLLGSQVPAPARAEPEPEWDIDTALLYYGEDGGRVQDLSIDGLARRHFVDDRYLTLGLTVDSLTGASPNGTLPQSTVQTYTRPSGRGGYTTAAGDLPLDNTFHDTRVAMTVDWQQPIGRLLTVDLGASASIEFDYLHAGVNGRISRDFNQRNTTLSAGLALAHDALDPVGGVPVALDPVRMASNGFEGEGGEDGEDGDGRQGGSLPAGFRRSESKDVFDAVVGITQVVSRNLLVQFNYSYSDSSGYLNDPYKLLSVVDGVTGDAILLEPPPGTSGPLYLAVYENRPDSRVKQSLYTQAKYFWHGRILDASYRYMTDDWGIDSHTLDVRFRIPAGGTGYLEPHLRRYSQSAADFYRLSLVDGEPLPAVASADYRLGDFDATTAGFKYGWKTRAGNDASVRLEVYRQSGNVSAGLLIGNQVERNNYPDLTAVILQFGYRFGR